MVTLVSFPKNRRHTYYFLSEARSNAQVFLTTEIDMSAVRDLRENFRQQGESLSYITFLIKVISRTIKDYPYANSSLHAGWWPKLALYEQVVAKFTLDKTAAGERLVAAAAIEDSDRLSEVDIQKAIDIFKAADYENSDQFEKIRKLNNVSRFLGRLLYRLILSNPVRRQAIQGSFTITSLGHRPIRAFFPISANTLAFGVGAMEDKVVVDAGNPVVKPLMPVSMAFDHRVIDGAMAADILSEIKAGLENYQVAA